MGGGGGGGVTGYNYTAAVMIGLCEGPTNNILNVWSGKEKTTLDTLGLSVSLGAHGQAVWGYLTTAHPSEAIGYTDLCHVDSPLMQLGSNADIPNLSFEIQGPGILAGQVDAKPDFIITDFLTNATYGAGWTTAKLADMTAYATYCRAAGLFVSPAFTEQQAAADHVKEILKATNSEAIWSQGKLKIIPYADAAITGNGVTYTPNLTPTYDLNDDDFIVSPGEDPVRCSRITTADAYNHIQIEFCNRAKDYNIEIAEARDQADIEAKGLRTMDPIKMHMICDAAVARVVAQLVLQRTLYIRNTYQFKLGWKHCRLEAMDLATITDTAMGLNLAPVLITEIEEDEDGQFDVTAEEYPFGVNSHSLYPHQDALGYVPNYQVAPGNINPPVMFEPPDQLVSSRLGLEVWIAASGGINWGGCDVWASTDDAHYEKVGTINGNARTGVLSALLASGVDPDAVNTLSVDLTLSRGQMLSGTQADADALQTLCYVDGELISYQTATLTAANKYNLTYLRRGAYGSLISSHNINSQFARLDQSILKYAFTSDMIGKTIYLKFASFNIYGGANQQLSEISPYTYNIAGTAIKSALPNVLNLVTFYQGNQTVLKWDPVSDFREFVYEIRFGATFNQAMILGTTSNTNYVATSSGTYWVTAKSMYAYSAAPTQILIAGATIMKNVVATFDEYATGWTGAKTGGAEVDGAGRVWLKNISGVVQTPGYYEIPSGHIVDVGSVQTCQLSIDYTALSDSPANMVDSITDFDSVANLDGDYAGYSNVQMQVALSQDGTTWGSWSNFLPGPYSARKFKFRAVLTTINTSITAVLSAFTFTVDMPDRVETRTQIAVPSGGTTITYAKPFQIRPNEQVTIINPSTGDYIAITSASATGFTLQILNGGAGVARNVNVLAQGY